jgi:hypothetical protein
MDGAVFGPTGWGHGGEGAEGSKGCCGGGGGVDDGSGVEDAAGEVVEEGHARAWEKI